MKMNIYVNGRLVPQSERQAVAFDHKEFTVSIAQGKGLNFTEVVIFPKDGKGLEDHEPIPFLERQFTDVSEAIEAIDKLTDLINAGLLRFEESD